MHNFRLKRFCEFVFFRYSGSYSGDNSWSGEEKLHVLLLWGQNVSLIYFFKTRLQHWPHSLYENYLTVILVSMKNINTRIYICDPCLLILPWKCYPSVLFPQTKKKISHNFPSLNNPPKGVETGRGRGGGFPMPLPVLAPVPESLVSPRTDIPAKRPFMSHPAGPNLDTSTLPRWGRFAPCFGISPLYCSCPFSWGAHPSHFSALF